LISQSSSPPPSAASLRPFLRLKHRQAYIRWWGMTPSPLSTTLGRPSARGGLRWRLMSVRRLEAVGGLPSGKVDERKIESLSSKGGEWVRSEGSRGESSPELPLSIEDVGPLTESQPSSEGWPALTMLALGAMAGLEGKVLLRVERPSASLVCAGSPAGSLVPRAGCD
jgi:hypothetical protein